MSKSSEWQGIIEAQEASRQSAAAYCREHGIGEKAFYYWKKRLSASRSGAFVPLTQRLETIRLRSGEIAVEVPATLPLSAFEIIVRALRANG